MPTSLTINNTISPLAGGVNSYGGSGEKQTLVFNGVYILGDEVTVDLTDNLTGTTYQFGAGNVTGVDFSYAYTFGNKVYGLGGSTAYFSALSLPVIFNDPNAAGNGFISMGNYFSTPENLAAIAPYQGKLIFAFRRLVQIWTVDPDPANYALNQSLPNIGTIAPLSVQPVGDMDVYMLADNGVRSVRVRDASNNAIIADIGTPIDAIIQPLLAVLTDAQKSLACGAVDPASNRYWVYIPKPDGSAGNIFTFSYFPSSQIAAWGSYSPTYQVAVAAPATNYTASMVTYTGLTIGKRYAWTPSTHEVSITNGTQVLKKTGAFVAMATTAVVIGTGATVSFTGALTVTTSFVPQKFVTYNGQVWCRAGDSLYQYGGSDNNSYDNCGLGFTTPYINADEPATNKTFTGCDAAMVGTWALGFSGNYTTGIFKNVFNGTASTFLFQNIGLNVVSTHYAFNGLENGNGYALFSNVMAHYKQANEKGS